MTQVEWTMLHPGATLAHLGNLPSFLREDDPDRAARQLDKGYARHGGFTPQPGFTLTADNCLVYPDDPPLRPLAEAKLRDETIVLYEFSFVAVIQPDRSFKVCRMD